MFKWSIHEHHYHEMALRAMAIDESGCREWTKRVIGLSMNSATSGQWVSLRVILSPRASLVAQTIKNLPAVQETWVQSLGQEDPLEKGMATYSNMLAWRIPWTEESGVLQSMRSQRVGHNWATNTHTHIHREHLRMSGNIFDCYSLFWEGLPQASGG